MRTSSADVGWSGQAARLSWFWIRDCPNYRSKAIRTGWSRGSKPDAANNWKCRAEVCLEPGSAQSRAEQCRSLSEHKSAADQWNYCTAARP